MPTDCTQRKRLWNRLPQSLFAWLAAVVCFLPASLEAGHPVSVTEARIFVSRTSARARISLFAEDLLLFQGLEPDGEGVLSAEQLKKGLEQHKGFLTERVTLRDAEGNLIPSRVTDLEPFEIPEKGIPEEDLMLYQATYELEFPFDSPPEFLTFQQDITDENYILPSEMKVAIHQTGTGNVIAGTLQPAGAVTHRFDWDALLAPEASDEEYESWLEKQRQDTLGITSYSSVYSFIYVEPGEVRHEVLIPLANLTSIIPIQHADPAFLEVAEQDAVRSQIREWLADGNPTRINGQDVTPAFSSIDFYGLSLRDFAQKSEARRVSFASGRVGIILRYVPAEGLVSDVNLTWDTFQSSLRKIRSVVVPWNGSVQRFEFSRFKKQENNVFRWQAAAEDLPQLAQSVTRELPDPPVIFVPAVTCAIAVGILALLALRRVRWPVALIGMLLAGACWPVAQVEMAHPLQPVPQLTNDRQRSIAEQLHQGTYQALAFGSEQQIYQALERFVDGDLLETLYLQLRDSLAVREQGGAIARVAAVEYLEGDSVTGSPDPLMWPGYQFRSTWLVKGSVEHWGHLHERRNQFSALLNVEPIDGFWKITSLQVDSQETLSGSTSLRKIE